MWNKIRSVKLSIVVCWIAIAMFAVCLGMIPAIFNLYFLNYRGMSPVIVTSGFKTLMIMCMYIGVIFALCALYCLIKLLNNISRDKVFVDENVLFLRLISWFCFGGAAVCLVAAFEYVPTIIIAIAAAFVGLVLRVVKNVMQAAVSLREENDLTI